MQRRNVIYTFKSESSTVYKVYITHFETSWGGTLVVLGGNDVDLRRKEISVEIKGTHTY